MLAVQVVLGSSLTLTICFGLASRDCTFDIGVLFVCTFHKIIGFRFWVLVLEFQF